MPATLAIIASTFSGRRRARAIGIWAGVGGIGAAAGPLLGGWLFQHFWWGSVFLINVPVAIAAFVGGIFALGESRASERPNLDPVGVVLSSLGLTALTYGFIVSSTDGWASTQVVVALVLAVVLLTVFILWDGRRSNPFLDLGLFRNRTFSSALGAVTAVFFVMFGVSYLASQYIQFVQGADPFEVGIRFIPSAAATILGSNLAARLAARFGLRTIMLVGMGLVTCGLVTFSTLSVASGILARDDRLRPGGLRHGSHHRPGIQCDRGNAAARQDRCGLRCARHGPVVGRRLRGGNRGKPGRGRLSVVHPQGLRGSARATFLPRPARPSKARSAMPSSARPPFPASWVK